MANSEKSANLNEQAKAEFQRLTAGKHAYCYLQPYCAALDSVLPVGSWAFFSCEGDIDVCIVGERSISDTIELVELVARSIDCEESLLTVCDHDV